MPEYIKLNDNKQNIKCHFCNGNHACRDCPKEAEMASTYRKKVGGMFENWVSANVKCPNCKGHLRVIGNHTPSLDLICENPNCTKNKYECKSKCLSVKNLPPNVILPHGSFYDFVYRINEGLNLIVVIYGVDRIKKTINIREVIYADNKDLINSNIIQIEKRQDTNLSTILIKDRTQLNKIKHNNNICLNFTNTSNFYNMI